MSILGIQQADLQKMLSKHFGRSIPIESLMVEKETADLGGWNGEKALVRVDTTHRDVGIHRVILKQVTADFSHEADLYVTLNEMGAPVAQMYGYRDHGSGCRTMVLEYLPISIDWPIPPDYHLSWADSAARMAALPLTGERRLRKIAWLPGLERYLADIGNAVSIGDELLQSALRDYGLTAAPELCRKHLPDLLEKADRLPCALNHGEPYSPHTGQRQTGEEVLFFDIGSAAIGPRFMDLIAAIIDHGEPYEIPVEQVARRYLETYNLETGSDLSWKAFWPEVETCRALVAVQRLRVTTDWVIRALSAEDENKSEIWDGSRMCDHPAFAGASEILQDTELTSEPLPLPGSVEDESGAR